VFFRRKKKFEQKGGASGSSARFDTKLIEDVDGEVGFFHCTVEVGWKETSSFTS
jgi:hypothetical protein